MEQEVRASPVMFGRLTCQPSDSEVYLGEVIHSRGLEAGLEATINSRLGKVRGGNVQGESNNRGFQAASHCWNGRSLDSMGKSNSPYTPIWMWRLDRSRKEDIYISSLRKFETNIFA